jgi:BCD family chlorophyll transporter-like MFS transporter
MSARPIGWGGIVRLGLIQACLGSVVVLATSTMNRVMTIELALPAVVPGALVAFHYAIQILRPRLGYGSDVGGRSTSWIIGGMATLAAGAIAAALAISLMASNAPLGLALAALGFAAIGIGVGAAGTSLLVLLAKRVAPERRPVAASVVWVMMIAGFVITSGATSQLLDPYSSTRLIAITAGVAAIALVITTLAVWGIEGRSVDSAQTSKAKPAAKGAFMAALAEVWAEPQARRFAIFVFLSMFAYSAQELVLEPFGGAVFQLTPAGTAKITGLQHGGALVGMILVGIAGSVFAGKALGSLRTWTIAGCAGSAFALIGLALAGFVGPAWPLQSWIFGLGVANGAFAVAAIGAMMGLAGKGKGSREGTRMGLWGAAQAIAFAFGGFAATVASDLARLLLGSPSGAYAAVFLAQALLFFAAANLARRVFHNPAEHRQTDYPLHATATGQAQGD